MIETDASGLFMLILMAFCIIGVLFFGFLACVNAWKMTFDSSYERYLKEEQERLRRGLF